MSNSFRIAGMRKRDEINGASVAALRRKYLEEGAAPPEGLIDELEADPRRSARALAASLRARVIAGDAEAERMRRLLMFESELWESGIELIAGVDEAGVGPMAGPLVAGAVILKRDSIMADLNDSKKLDEKVRDALAGRIREGALAWSVGIASVEEIDELNVYRAGLLAMKRAVDGLSRTPGFLLVDARTVPDCAIPQRGIVRGDSLSASIAAASIIAKTVRDALMLELDEKYPGYGFASHKGYATPAHFRALRELGPVPIHRRSYRPVREALGLEPVQGSLLDSMEASGK